MKAKVNYGVNRTMRKPLRIEAPEISTQMHEEAIPSRSGGRPATIIATWADESMRVIHLSDVHRITIDMTAEEARERS